MLTDAPTPAAENLKEAFQSAVAIQNWPEALQIGYQIKKDSFSFMEQIELILLLSQQEPEIATKMLYTNAFSHTFVMIGLTQPNVTPLESCPYFIPAMETELKQAVIERRLEDAEKIKRCGQWCLSSRTLADIAELQRQLLGVPAQTYLPLQAAGNAPANVTHEAPPGYKPRRFTH